IIGLLNSTVFLHLVPIMNPTLNFQVKNIRSMPMIYEKVDIVNNLVKQNIAISKADWDRRETSWDFERHPLV
ncbi:MAG: hypothetical protein IKN43_06980, partial [Selenomonadaceae bacterium]|nr:hypothetical protein [Selenomonadaceae bacterium]